MKYYKLKVLGVFAFLLGFMAQAHISETGRYTKQKRLKKEFDVNASVVLEVDNSYGDVNITTWNQDKITMEIIVKVSGSDEDAVLDQLREIDINFQASPSKVTAKTIYGEAESSWWQKLASSWNSSNYKKEITYTIKMPRTGSIDIKNDYGSIAVDEIDGNSKIRCDYGQLTLGKLNGRDNQLFFDYTNNSSIDFINRGTLKADYSSFELIQGNDVVLQADYTKANISNIDILDYRCDYGNMRIGTANSLEGNGDYFDLRIQHIGKTARLKSDYGKINIGTTLPRTQLVDITADYTQVQIGYDPKHEFVFNLYSDYGSLKTDAEVRIDRNESNTKQNSGFHLNANSANKISVRTDYGGIKLLKKE